jgi:hypothetical protein
VEIICIIIYQNLKQSCSFLPRDNMTRFLLTFLFLGAFLSFQQAHSQSLYMDDNSIGFSGGFGYASNTANLTGTSFNVNYSLDRNIDFAVAYDRYSMSEFGGYHSDVAGTIVFYPKKQWEDDLFTMQVFAAGANSTAPMHAGFSAILGTAVSSKMDVSDYVSFYPRAGFRFIPFRPGSPSQYSAITVDTSFTFQLTQGVKLLVSPGYHYEFGKYTSNFAMMGGIVL